MSGNDAMTIFLDLSMVGVMALPLIIYCNATIKFQESSDAHTIYDEKIYK